MPFRALKSLWSGVRSASTAASPPNLAATSPNLSSALTLIRSQPSHYIIASLHRRRYLLTARDLLTVPHLRGANVGDVINLSKIHELGSRDYTLQGDPLVPKGVVSVHATVVEHTKGPMEYIYKKKRRKGYQKTIQHKQGYTRLRIGPINIANPLEMAENCTRSSIEETAKNTLYA